MPKLSDFQVPEAITDIARQLQNKGHEVYIVGGAVRDFFLKRPVHDYDLTTSASPEEVQTSFKRTVPTGIEHGTVTVLMGGGTYEITTYRLDGKYSDSRHPESVTFTRNLDEDLKRRDFSINALAFSPLEKKLEDHFDGLSDLENKTVRCIGNAKERFEEDALRMMRACRFATQLSFTIEESSRQAISDLSANLQNISVERIREEFNKILLSPKPSVGIELLRECHLLEYFLPELLESWQVSQNHHHKYDVYYHLLAVLDASQPSLESRLAALLHDIAKPRTKFIPEGKTEPSFYNHENVGAKMSGHILRRMKYSNETIENVKHLVKHHMFHYTDDWSKGAVRRFVARVGEETLEPLFALREADRIGNGLREATCEEIEIFKTKIAEVLEESRALKITDLAINGHDLMTQFDLKPSKLLGDILKHCLELVLDEPELNEKEKLLEIVKAYLEAA